MFQRLVASRPTPAGRPLEGSGALAVMAHVLVVAGAALATVHPHAAARAAPPLLISWPDEPTPREPGGGPLAPPVGPGGMEPVPIALPTELPAIDARLPFDTASWRASATGRVPATPLVGGSDAWTGPQVDEPPALLGGRQPRYPELLRAAGISGRVVVQAIVDTAGRVEPGSVAVVETPNRGFDAPARAFVLSARFRVGRVHGLPVRVLVRVPIEFSLSGVR